MLMPLIIPLMMPYHRNVWVEYEGCKTLYFWPKPRSLTKTDWPFHLLDSRQSLMKLKSVFECLWVSLEQVTARDIFCLIWPVLEPLPAALYVDWLDHGGRPRTALLPADLALSPQFSTLLLLSSSSPPQPSRYSAGAPGLSLCHSRIVSS